MGISTIRIGKLDLPANIWLNCVHCDAYFQVKDLRPEPWFGHQGCPFCGAAGFGIDIIRKNPNLGKNKSRREKRQQARG
jgi:hypothetical protein